jgi:hypothetical protein
MTRNQLQQQGQALAPMMLEKYMNPNDAMKNTLLEDRLVYKSRIDMVLNSWKVLYMRNIAATYLLLDQDKDSHRSTEAILTLSVQEGRHEVVLRCHHCHHDRILRQMRDAAHPKVAAEARHHLLQESSSHRVLIVFRRKKIHHPRSQDLWLMQTPNSGPPQRP